MIVHHRLSTHAPDEIRTALAAYLGEVGPARGMLELESSRHALLAAAAGTLIRTSTLERVVRHLRRLGRLPPENHDGGQAA
jgi:hypothetical protein